MVYILSTRGTEAAMGKVGLTVGDVIGVLAPTESGTRERFV